MYCFRPWCRGRSIARAHGGRANTARVLRAGSHVLRTSREPRVYRRPESSRVRYTLSGAVPARIDHRQHGVPTDRTAHVDDVLLECGSIRTGLLVPVRRVRADFGGFPVRVVRRVHRGRSVHCRLLQSSLAVVRMHGLSRQDRVNMFGGLRCHGFPQHQPDGRSDPSPGAGCGIMRHSAAVRKDERTPR